MEVYNSLSNTKEIFIPNNKNEIKMYVCGPTVYDDIHIGNARCMVVFDVLYRLLKYKYKNVKYVRNITDVDDKIINKSKNTSVNILTSKNLLSFQEDMKYLNCLPPSYEPQVSDNIEEIKNFIQQLINNKNAYIKDKCVYFSVSTFSQYGCLSNRKSHSSNDDFVLWKQCDKLFWKSPWGNGRPGWHIECSAMALKYLGNTFDLHCGGKDLLFPHHENENAQTCSLIKKKSVNYWMHSGMIKNKEGKMSKSLGNIIKIKEMHKYSGGALRLSFLMTHYRQDMTWNESSAVTAEKMLKKFVKYIDNEKEVTYSEKFMHAIEKDLNTPLAISILHALCRQKEQEKCCKKKRECQRKLLGGCKFLGIL